MPLISVLDPRKSSVRTQKVGGKFPNHVIGLFTNMNQSDHRDDPHKGGSHRPIQAVRLIYCDSVIQIITAALLCSGRHIGCLPAKSHIPTEY
jgi:hypothetical protein